MIDRKVRHRRGRPGNARNFRQVFINRVHQLLELGYQKLNPTDWSTAEETAITGEIVRAIDEILDNPSQSWFQHFSVHDDPPVNAPGRLGKRRKRLDIKIVSSQRTPRSKFSFEAKRLGKRNLVSGYVGSDGLRCFLRGDYAAAEDDAGMLGYVQSDTSESWAAKIQAKLEASRSGFDICSTYTWRECQMEAGPSHIYQTRHNRVSLGRPIDIYHTLLVFC